MNLGKTASIRVMVAAKV